MKKPLLPGSNIFYIAVVLLATLGVYINNLPNEFVTDDILLVLGNEWITDIRFIPTIITSSVYGFTPETDLSNHYRPLYFIYFMICYYLFGFEAWGYHLFNNALHALSAVAIFLAATKAFSDDETSLPGEPGLQGRRVAALFVALLFATHPVNTESVTWWSAVSEASFGLFFFLGFYLYIISNRSPKSLHYWLAILAYLLCVASKETGITLPACLIAYDLFVKRVPLLAIKTWITRFAAFAAVGILYIAARTAVLGGFTPMKNEVDTLGTGDMIINFIPLVGIYIKRLVFPLKIVHYDYFVPTGSVADALFIASAIAILIVIAVCVWSYKRSRLTLFAMVCIFVPLLPVFYISFLKGQPALAERYLYISTMGFAFIAVMAVWNLTVRFIPGGEQARKAAIAALVIITVLFGIRTIDRNPDWKDAKTLWTVTIEDAPGNKYAYNNLGILLVKDGEVDSGIEQFRISLKIDPRHAPARNNLGIALAMKGDFEGAAREFREAIIIDPYNYRAGKNLENALKMLGR